MEAHEALIAGALGLSALYAWSRRQDPLDKWLALVALWICVTGIAALLMTQLADPARYVRLALRLTGPPLLLLVCEESVRSERNPGSRTTSFIFAGVIYALSVGALIYFRGGTLVELALPDWLFGLRFGMTAWMAILAVCLLASLMTVVPSAFRRNNPGYAGYAALLLLFSEGWAAIDPRWGSGTIELGGSVSYRSALTFLLAAVALLKAHQPSWTFLIAAGGRSQALSAKAEKTTPASSPDKNDDQEETRSDSEPAERKSKTAERTSTSPKSKKKSKKKGKK